MAFSLWLAFFGASVLLAIAPGSDNLFVLMQSAVFGVRAGMIVVLPSNRAAAADACGCVGDCCSGGGGSGTLLGHQVFRGGLFALACVAGLDSRQGCGARS